MPEPVIIGTGTPGLLATLDDTAKPSHGGRCEDHREATLAFVARREPVFKGR
jgi:hypothetical protein